MPALALMATATGSGSGVERLRASDSRAHFGHLCFIRYFFGGRSPPDLWSRDDGDGGRRRHHMLVQILGSAGFPELRQSLFEILSCGTSHSRWT